MWDLIVSVPDRCLSFYFATYSSSSLRYTGFVFRCIARVNSLFYSTISSNEPAHEIMVLIT